MSEQFIIGFARQAIELALMVSMPLMGIGLAVGLITSIFQAATQLQEQTLSFIPKVTSIFVALLIAFPWMLDKMMQFTTDIFLNFPTWIR